MRIAIVAPLFNRRGGVERYVWNLAHQLSRSHQVTVVTAQFEGIESANLRWLAVPAVKSIGFLQTLTFAVMAQVYLHRFRDQFDVVHGHGASCFRQDVVTAHSVHKAWFLTSLKALPVASAKWWLKIFNPLHYVTLLVEGVSLRRGNSKLVVAISTVIRKELERYYRVPSSRMHLIASGIDHQEFYPADEAQRQQAREALGIGAGEFVMLFVGNELKRKNLPVIMEAMARLGRSDLVLVVVGRAETGPFVKLAADLGLQDQVRFYGPSGKITDYYRAADSFVFPTLYEAFSLVIAEAMAMGLAIITTAGVGAADELFSDGINGLLLQNPNDADEVKTKIEMLFNRDFRRTLGAAAHRTSLNYSWEKMADNYLQAYRRVLARPTD